jgi:hypothetical protein
VYCPLTFYFALFSACFQSATSCQHIDKLSHNNTNMRIQAYSLAQELQQIFSSIIRTYYSYVKNEKCCIIDLNLNFSTSPERRYVVNKEYRDTDRKRFQAVHFSESIPPRVLHNLKTVNVNLSCLFTAHSNNKSELRNMRQCVERIDSMLPTFITYRRQLKVFNLWYPLLQLFNWAQII